VTSIKAIETVYNGYRFRSRLEARWAVFFDEIGVPYDYEPEGFDLGEGLYYLPDFYLPEQNYYVEIKGQMTKEDEEKVYEFGLNGQQIIVLGNIPPLCNDVFDLFEWVVDMYDDGWGAYFIPGDFPYLPCVCPKCGKFGFEWEGLGNRICHGKHGNLSDENTACHPKVIRAYSKARQARFEHGETPTIRRR